MRPEDARRLQGAAGLLAIVVAAIHLQHPSLGVRPLLVYAQLGYLGDPRPLVFTLSALAILLGIALAIDVGSTGVAVGPRRRWLYALGAALMAVHLLSYVAWHTVLDHGAFWPHIEPRGHDHGGTIRVVADHLREDAFALASKVAELFTFVALSTLLLAHERPSVKSPNERPSNERPPPS
ncbi:MAG: hypothetical protein ACQETB_04830 [Halobacteriota archaeon]